MKWITFFVFFLLLPSVMAGITIRDPDGIIEANVFQTFWDEDECGYNARDGKDFGTLMIEDIENTIDSGYLNIGYNYGSFSFEPGEEGEYKLTKKITYDIDVEYVGVDTLDGRFYPLYSAVMEHYPYSDDYVYLLDSDSYYVYFRNDKWYEFNLSLEDGDHVKVKDNKLYINGERVYGETHEFDECDRYLDEEYNVDVADAKPSITVTLDGEPLYGKIYAYKSSDLDYDYTKYMVLEDAEPYEEGVWYSVRILRDKDITDLPSYLKFSQNTPVYVNLDRLVEVEVKKRPDSKSLVFVSDDFFCTDAKVQDKGIFTVSASRKYLEHFDNKVALPSFTDKYRFYFQSNYGYKIYFKGSYTLDEDSKIVIDGEDVYVNGEKLESLGSKSDFELYSLKLSGECTDLPTTGPKKNKVIEDDQETKKVDDGWEKLEAPDLVFALFSGDGKYTKEELQEYGEEIKKEFMKDLDICADIHVISAGSCKGFKYDGEKDYDNWNLGKDCVLAENPSYSKYFNNTIYLAVGKKRVGGSYFDYGVNGKSSSTIPGFAFIRYGKMQVALHEIGHCFGLGEGYCYNPPGNDRCPEKKDCSINPTDPELGGDEPAFWGIFDWFDQMINGDYCEARTGYRQSVKGNRWSDEHDGRTYMAMEDAPGPRGWDKYDKKQLENHELLRCD